MSQKDFLIYYLRKRYDPNIEIRDFENKNQCFDVITSNSSMNMTIEYKTRYFETGKTDFFLHKDDILIEIIQSTPYIKNTEIKDIDPYKLNIAIGWFYKCSADRLIYMRTIDSNLYDLIDIDFKLFKQWLLNNFNKFKTQYSNKTTGTINLIVPFSDIPKPIYFLERNNT